MNNLGFRAGRGRLESNLKFRGEQAGSDVSLRRIPSALEELAELVFAHHLRCRVRLPSVVRRGD